MSAKSGGKTTAAARDTRIPLSDIDFLDTDEEAPASSSSRSGRPTLHVDEDDDVLEVVPVADRPTKRRRVPTIKEIIYRPLVVDATPRAGASDISTRLERIEAAQTKLTTLVTSSTEQLGKRIQKVEKSSGDVMKRLERVEALLEKVLERLG